MDRQESVSQSPAFLIATDHYLPDGENSYVDRAYITNAEAKS
jgi:hypothetical protein